MRLVTGYLVYRPARGYEESITPYFVCHTKGVAEEAARSMNEFLARAAKRFPLIDDALEADKWCDANDKRTAALDRARWPFGVDLRDDIPDAASQTTVAVVPIRMDKCTP